MPLALEPAIEEQSPSRESLDEHIQRLLNSPQFVRAETQRRLLEYLWNHRSENLSEYALATEALGRKADFDSTADASVRVHISRLRRKLKDYYQEIGEPETLVIPTGTHQLVVSDMPAALEPELRNITALPETSDTASPAILRWLPLIALASVIALFGAGIAGWFVGHRTTSIATPQPTTFWAAFLGSNSAPVKIILPTPVFFSFTKEPDIRLRSTRVNDFHDASTNATFQALTKDLGTPSLGQDYTVTSDTLAAVELARYLDSVGSRERISFDVMRDSDMLILEHSNVIALGTHQTLHPLHEYIEAMDFSLNHDEAAALNAKPLAGEQSRYEVIRESKERLIRPSVIALLPGQGPGLKVLLVESRHTAAIMSVLSSTSGADSIEAMVHAHGNPAYWEMVVETELQDNHPLRTWPIAVHSFSSHAPGVL
jgi:hypothetical protein